MSHGFGGIAILWKNIIDKHVLCLEDGNERIQCVEYTTSTSAKILFISVYLPSKGKQSSVHEFQLCIYILTEIILNFKTTHEIVIGGDLNEDLGSVNSSKRLLYLDKLIKEQELCFSLAGNTYTNPQGADRSEIDHFLSRTSK